MSFDMARYNSVVDGLDKFFALAVEQVDTPRGQQRPQFTGGEHAVDGHHVP